MICLTRPSNSIDWLCRRGSGRRGVDPSPLLAELIAVAMAGGTVVKMIVSLSGLCVELRGLNHIIIRKPSGAARRFILPQQDVTRRPCFLVSLVRYVALVGFRRRLLEKSKRNESSKRHNT